MCVVCPLCWGEKGGVTCPKKMFVPHRMGVAKQRSGHLAISASIRPKPKHAICLFTARAFCHGQGQVPRIGAWAVGSPSSENEKVGFRLPHF